MSNTRDVGEQVWPCFQPFRNTGMRVEASPNMLIVIVIVFVFKRIDMWGRGLRHRGKGRRGRGRNVIRVRLDVSFDPRGMTDAFAARHWTADIVDGIEMIRCQCLTTGFGVEMCTEASGCKGLATGWTMFGTRRAWC